MRLFVPVIALCVSFSASAWGNQDDVSADIQATGRALVKWAKSLDTSKPDPFPVGDAELEKAAEAYRAFLESEGLSLSPMQAVLAYGIAIQHGASVTADEEKPDAVSIHLPSYDSAAYCDKIAARAQGSNAIKRGCLSNENDAKRALSQMNIPEKTVTYCDRIAKRAGGSYSIFQGCVQNELN